MPRLPKDYSKGLIYKLCCKDTSVKETYVGSTTNFTQRKRGHKNACNNPNPNTKGYNLKVYQFIRANGGFQNWNMVLIEYYPCETELELCRKEEYWKQELQASLNSISPHIYETKQENYQKNKEQILEKMKENYQKNKEQIVEKKKENYQKNKEQILEKAKENYQKNKEKIAEQKKQKYTCECGSVICKGDKAKHEKTAKHLSMLQKQSL